MNTAELLNYPLIPFVSIPSSAELPKISYPVIREDKSLYLTYEDSVGTITASGAVDWRPFDKVKVFIGNGEWK